MWTEDVQYPAPFSVAGGASLAIETGVDFGLPETRVRTYSYQDPQYFLTHRGDPSGQLDWSYDKIGNRLSEVRDGVTDTYSYPANAAGTGKTAHLTQIQLGAGGTRDYAYGAAGHLELSTEGTSSIDFTNDGAGRLSRSPKLRVG